MNAGCVVAAAGSGKRFGAKKQFLTLKGRLVIDYSIDVFKKLCDSIVISVKAEDVSFIKDRFGFARVVEGGKERMHSVYNGLSALNCDVVLIHDAARPLINLEMVEKLIETADRYGAAIPVIDVVDTLKRLDNGYVFDTIDRGSAAVSQTPQAFRYDMLKSAYDSAIKGEKIYTDEAAVWEEYYGKIKTIKGSRRNIKITSKDDWEFVECLLG